MTLDASTRIGHVHEYALVVHEAHLDTFGHVNNATYLQLFEQARWDWITRGGYGLDRIQRERRGPVILDCNVQFRREVTNRQSILIRSWIVSWGPKLATIRQELFRVAVRPDEHEGGETKDCLEPLVPGELCCSANFTMAFFDLAIRRIVQPSDEWLAAFGLTQADVFG